MSFFKACLGILFLAIAAGIFMLLIDYGAYAYSQIKAGRAMKKLSKDSLGLAILAERLEEQRKKQIRHIKERDAADQELLDRAEEYRGDFDRDN